MRVSKEILELFAYTVVDIADPVFSYAKQKYMHNGLPSRRSNSLHTLKSVSKEKEESLFATNGRKSALKSKFAETI